MPPVIRGSGIQSGSYGSIVVPFPAGSQIGDRAIIMGGMAYPLTGTVPPSGWTSPISTVSEGADWQPICFSKVLTSGDISTGSVTVNFTGTFDVVIAIVTYVGDPGNPRVAAGMNSGVVGQSLSIDSNGLGDSNNTALSFVAVRTSGSGGSGRTTTTSLGAQLQFSDDGAYTYGALTNIPSVGGFISQTWTFGTAPIDSVAPLVLVIGPVPTINAGTATVIEREFGESIEPWNLQGLDSGIDLILGALVPGDVVVVGYTYHTTGSNIGITDTNNLSWQTLYATPDSTSFFYAVVTENYPAGDIIQFTGHGYSASGRAVVIRGADSPTTTAVASGASSPVAVSLSPVSVSYPFTSPASGPWVTSLINIAGSYQTVTVLMTSLASASTGHNGNPGAGWTETFPSDDTYLNLWTFISSSATIAATANAIAATAGIATAVGSSAVSVSIAEVKITVTYQNPGNYIYAHDLNSWGDGGTYGLNNGCPYSAGANIVLGSITLSQPGGQMFPLQHIVGYFDAVGSLGEGGGPTQPDIWILPNEISAKKGTGFVQLPEVLQEPPIGQNTPSTSLQSLRFPVNMMNSQLASQFIHHLQVKIQFEPECAPNTIKAISFKELQD